VTPVNLIEFEGKRPSVHPDAWIAPTATLIGDVTVEAGASVWYGAVLRGDVAAIVIGAGANVQDNSVLHAGPGESLVIGAHSTVGHSCMVHCAEVGEGSLVGNGAIVLDGARIGAGTLVAAGAVVTPGTTVGDGVLVGGTPARVLRSIEDTPAAGMVEANAPYYVELAKRHRDGAQPVT